MYKIYVCGVWNTMDDTATEQQRQQGVGQDTERAEMFLMKGRSEWK